MNSGHSQSPARTSIGFVLMCCLATLVAGPPLIAQEAADFFRQNCMTCHTIGGGRLTGPDLKGVLTRKDREWLTRFLQNPQAMMDQGDPYAAQLRQAARGIVMPTFSGMSPTRAESLLALIEGESKLEKSQFAGLQVSDRPFAAADIDQGHRLFTGVQHLANAGPPCISCHTARDLGGLSGGRLGPDLTRVFERLQGRKNLVAWLTAPATPTMSVVFKRHVLKPEEIMPVIAFLEDEARKGGEDVSSAPLTFLLIGLGGTVLALVLFDQIWKGRFRSVRKALVVSSIHRGEE
jgi:mono/diheme cytochrome c family protein